MFVEYVVIISSSISDYHLQNTNYSPGILLLSTTEIRVTVPQKTATSIPYINASEAGILDRNMTESRNMAKYWADILNITSEIGIRKFRNPDKKRCMNHDLVPRTIYPLISERIYLNSCSYIPSTKFGYNAKPQPFLLRCRFRVEHENRESTWVYSWYIDRRLAWHEFLPKRLIREWRLVESLRYERY